MDHHKNIVRLKAVANTLAELKQKVVFVGGATVSLYPDGPTYDIRPTDDIDVIVEILNYVDRTKLEARLRSIGFMDDIQSGITCRWKLKGIIVDIMPTNDPSMGPTNIWYPDGFKYAVDHKIDDDCIVKILSAPYFIAIKLEAHKSRGGNDGRTSTDFEDIIYVLENRETVWEEINTTEPSLKEYLRQEFTTLLDNPNHFEWIDSHVERFSPPSTYFIIEQLKDFISNQ